MRSTRSGECPFKFEEFLSLAWDSQLYIVSAMNNLKPKLVNWNKEVFGEIGQKKRKHMGHLKGIDRALQYRILDGQRPCSPDALVAEIIDRPGQWRWDLLEQVLPCDILLHIATVKPPLGVSYDALGWPLGANSVFTVRSTTIACRGTLHGPVEPVWKVIADFKGLRRVRMFLWLVFHERVLTNVERERRRLTHDPSCIACGNGNEDLDHILRFCPTTFCLWNQLIRPDAWNVFFTLPIKAWLLENLTTPFKFVAKGLLSAWSLNIPRLVVETDCLEAYKLIMGSNVRRGSSTLLPFIMDLLDRPWEVRLEHARRSGNALADRMAKRAFGNNLIVCCFLDPPSFCWDVLLRESIT
ncbi:hypothetical protein V6N11_040033 [Hibiscus sabdariffa]|uniref:Reverse transcriptase zinc-binding domain-containing protein n=1 Tax=Hibiscus sabdariffa TaxID=183260 RepID=A0ABR2RGW3_9ROSI